MNRAELLRGRRGSKGRQERPRIANIGPKSRPSAAKTADRGSKNGPGLPVEAQEQLKIANIGPKTAPRPPT